MWRCRQIFFQKFSDRKLNGLPLDPIGEAIDKKGDRMLSTAHPVPCGTATAVQPLPFFLCPMPQSCCKYAYRTQQEDPNGSKRVAIFPASFSERAFFRCERVEIAAKGRRQCHFKVQCGMFIADCERVTAFLRIH